MARISLFFLISFTISVFCTAQHTSGHKNHAETTAVQRTIFSPIFEALNRIQSLKKGFGTTLAELIKLPFNGVISVINSVCLSVLQNVSKSKSKSIEVNKLQFILGSGTDSGTYSLNELEKLLTDANYDEKKILTIFIPGWMSSGDRVHSSEVKKLSEAYAQRSEIFFVVFDINADLNDLLLWATYDSHKVGTLLGESLAKPGKLTNDNLHLIGASIGAHIAGYAGQTYREKTGKTIKRITGLDPGSICSNAGTTTSGLRSSTADFVDVIHTTSALGDINPLGDADFYVNRITSNQPGCTTTLCSHTRSVDYYAESVVPQQEKHFRATECSSTIFFVLGRCANNPSTFMGLVTPPHVRGKHYLYTNSASPYGKNHETSASKQTPTTSSTNSITSTSPSPLSVDGKNHETSTTSSADSTTPTTPILPTSPSPPTLDDTASNATPLTNTQLERK